jgi:putative hemolysin
MGSELLIVVGLLMANGLFAGAEIAVLSVRKTKLREQMRKKDRRALAVKSLRDVPERFLATVQIGMTVLGTTAAAVGGARMEASLEPTYVSMGLGGWATTASFATVIALVTFLELVIGELVPKSLALRYSDRYSLFVARPLLALSQLMRPIVWILTAVSNLVLRFFGDRTTFSEARLSRDELQQLVEEAAQTGSIDPRASEIA